jgi:hypothetical protein
MEPQIMVEDWIETGLVDRLEELTDEVAALRADRERVLTELVVARRWVALLAAEVERLAPAFAPTRGDVGTGETRSN